MSVALYKPGNRKCGEAASSKDSIVFSLRDTVVVQPVVSELRRCVTHHAIADMRVMHAISASQKYLESVQLSFAETIGLIVQFKRAVARRRHPIERPASLQLREESFRVFKVRFAIFC